MLLMCYTLHFKKDVAKGASTNWAQCGNPNGGYISESSKVSIEKIQQVADLFSMLCLFVINLETGYLNIRNVDSKVSFSII